MAKNISHTVDYDEKRLDLRHLPMITIDGEDAKDLDDAVSAEPLPNGSIRLGVHIADVSHYVRPNDTIDKEAYGRGTSVYLVDRVVPMLPEALSNGICSLNAGEDRYALSCIMDITKQGVVTDYTIQPSMIHVDRRCSYREIYKALEEDIIPDDLMAYMGLVHHLHEVAKSLMAMRHRRGALDFDAPEFKIILNDMGEPTRVVKRERTIAERIIEECMLIANETVSTFLESTKKGTVFRVHEPPKMEKLENLKFVIAYLGKEVHWPDVVQPRDVQRFLSLIEGTDIESVGQIMTLRSMQQAHYSAENKGHFGLASSSYTHFTSPIRRYPDLIIHRLIKKALRWDATYTNWTYDMAYLNEASAHSSKQEQVATEAERDVDDLKKVQYMASYVGEVFEGRVSSITSFGMFVEIDNGIDGLVPLALMNDDHYVYDEQRLLLVGRRTGKIFHLGQPVTVTLVKADVEKKQIDFMLGEVNPHELSRVMFGKRRDYKGKKQDRRRENRPMIFKDIEVSERKPSKKKGKKKAKSFVKEHGFKKYIKSKKKGRR